MRHLLQSASVIAATCFLGFHGPAMAKKIVIHAGHMIDGTGKSVRDNVSISVTDDRIVAVSNGFITPADAEVIDLSKMTVLPGFIDSHDHISNTGQRQTINRFVQTDGDAVINAVINVHQTLEWGFTSIRDLGSGPLTAPAIIRAVNSGKIEGPRIWSSMEPIGPTGGHSDPTNGVRPDLSFANRDNTVADGIEEIIKAVRSHHRRGATVIKIYPSGGVASIGDDPQAMTMTEEEMGAAVRTAHSLSMKVAAHAHGTLAINAAIRAGVDSIEHGTFANAESYRLMKEHGTFLVPTLLVADVIYQQAVNTPEALPPTVADKAKAVVPTMKANVTAAYKAGVRMAFGTDQGASYGRNKAEEFALMVGAGVTPADAILAATKNAAELLGQSDNIGSIQPGRFADIVAVAGEPMKDVTVLQKVDFVMKGGEVVKAGGKMLR